MTPLQYVVAFVSVLVVIHCNNVVRANPAVAASNNAALGKGELSRLLQQLLPKLRARMGHRAGLLPPPAALKANSVPPALVSSPEEVSFTDDEFEDLDQVDRFAAKRQSDDYGHWRYGKREFDDYGHMRFGR